MLSLGCALAHWTGESSERVKKSMLRGVPFLLGHLSLCRPQFSPTADAMSLSVTVLSEALSPSASVLSEALSPSASVVGPVTVSPSPGSCHRQPVSLSLV